MKKAFSKSTLIALIWALLLSAFSMGVFAQGDNAQPELASLYGEFDLQSSDLVTVIVELEKESIVEAKHNGKEQSKGALAAERGKVIAELKKKASQAEVTREYDYLFSGFSVKLPANELPALLATAGVKSVYPNVEYRVDQVGEAELISAEAYSPLMLKSAPYIGANEVWETLGYTGKGVTVAVLDTGTDYTHPDLAHAFGDYKGWDFVDHDNDPQETPIGDPRGEATTHGTHVAGTVAANGLIKGVAPEATLLAYRVLGPGGSGTTENVVAAIERAVQDGADVMNLSLGNTQNTPDGATSIALDRAMAEGVVAVTSNGNAGPENWTVGSPGTSRSAISVGATRLPYHAYNGAFTTNGMNDYPSAAVMGFAADDDLLALDGNTYEMVYVGLGYVEDYEGKDLEGKIAVISRGEIPFVDKASNARAAGAVGAIIFNNDHGQLPFEIPGMAVPTLKLDDVDGQKLVAELEEGYNEISFEITFSDIVEETVADFSSRGPVMYTWMIKPDVSAPGVNITSTVPTHHPENPYGYASAQGTSMASPHVAGAAALLLQANPQWSTEQVKVALMNSAEKVFDPNGNVYPHNTQGAGSIRIVDALQLDTFVLPGSHSFGVFAKDRGAQVETQHFTIRNLSGEEKRYHVDVQFDGNPNGIRVRTSNNTKVKSNSSTTVLMDVQVQVSKLAAGYYPGTITVSEGKNKIDVPTILFVQEPDYPRITSFHLLNYDREGLEYLVNLPGGAEETGLWIFSVDPVDYVGEANVQRNVESGLHVFSWDGTVNGEALAPGEYHVVAYATKKGVTDSEYGGTVTIE